jgi:hypothetical protein
MITAVAVCIAIGKWCFYQQHKAKRIAVSAMAKLCVFSSSDDYTLNMTIINNSVSISFSQTQLLLCSTETC